MTDKTTKLYGEYNVRDGEPKWLKVGAEVSMVWNSGAKATWVEDTTVEKILKRDIMLANGQRFRHTDRAAGYYTRHRGDTGSGLHDHLYPRGHRQAEKDRASIKLGNAVHTFQMVADVFAQVPSDENASKVRSAIAIVTIARNAKKKFDNDHVETDR